MIPAAAVLLSLLAGKILYLWLTFRFGRAGLTRLNYRGKKVAVSLGPVLVFSYLVAAAVLSLGEGFSGLLPAVTGLVGMGAAGMVDDLYEEEVQGYRGHVSALSRGDLTSGMFKAFTGVFLGVIIAGHQAGLSPVEAGTGVLLFVLWSNSLNQLDRRPGRAWKVFLVLAFLLVIFSGEKEEIAWIIPLLSLAVYLLPYDLKEESMLGDAGANFLGAALGTGIFLTHPFGWQLWWLAAGLLLNIAGEFFSFSKIIENNRVLKFLDDLGR